MSSTCRCGRPAGDAYVCSDCSGRLWVALGDVANLEEELDLTLSRQRRFGAATGGARGSESSLPFHAAASEAAAALRGLLVAWVRLCDEEHVPSSDTSGAYPANTLTAMSRWLLWRVDGLALHPAGSDAVDEITGAVEHGQRVIDRPKTPLPAGICGAMLVDDDGLVVRCERRLESDWSEPVIHCPLCGADHDRATRRAALLAEAEDYELPVSLLAQFADLSGRGGDLSVEKMESKVNVWVSRGLLTSHGVRVVRGRPRRTFRCGDVLELLAQDPDDRKYKRVAS